jgi:hypothetical protein
MSNPRRVPLQRDDLGVATTLGDFTKLAKQIELGWTEARNRMRDAGWPERSPKERKEPKIVIICRDCRANGTDTALNGSLAKDEHTRDTGHTGYSYVPATPLDPSSIDYADPTGDLAPNADRVSDDVLEMQDHWSQVIKHYMALRALTAPYLPTPWSSEEPACTVGGCDNAVERTKFDGYRGMEQVGKLWVAKPGATPMCAKHRSEQRRDVA